MKWGIKSGKELESLTDGVHFVEERSVVINAGKYRYPIFLRLLFYMFPILTRSKKIILLCLTRCCQQSIRLRHENRPTFNTAAFLTADGPSRSIAKTNI
jgi:hypothetical protein